MAMRAGTTHSLENNDGNRVFFAQALPRHRH
jgi:hypothetical protein